MANYENIAPLIENNVPRLEGKILHEEDPKSIPAFIGLIHKYLPQRALYFLKRFQHIYPNNKEVIAFCYYHFGKNYAGITPHDSHMNFTRALELFVELNHEIGIELTHAALMELDK